MNKLLPTSPTIEANTQGLRALIVQGIELRRHLIMPLMKTHTTIMWMLKYFNNKLEMRSKHVLNLNKRGYNKQIVKLNSKRNNNVFVMIKIFFEHVSKNVFAMSKRHVNNKDNLVHLKWPMLKGNHNITLNKK